MPTNSHDRAATGDDTKPRQATTSDDKATTGHDNDAALSQPQPLTVEEAAQLLGVSPRTVQRRCQNGKLSAKQAQGEFGEVWEIDRAAVEKQAATESDDKPRQQRRHSDDIETTSGDKEPRQAATGDDDSASDARAIIPLADERQNADRDSAPDFRARYIAQMEAENSFLKSQLEDANRNAAELRAALRKALEIAPRQLSAATPPDAAATMPNAASETEQERAQIATATNVPTNTPEAEKSPQNEKSANPRKEPRPLWRVILGIR